MSSEKKTSPTSSAINKNFVVLLYTNNELSKNEIKEMILFIIESKGIKQGINLPKKHKANTLNSLKYN